MSEESNSGNIPIHSLSLGCDEDDGNSSNGTELSSSEISRLVMDCVFYILVADQKKYVIKRSDINKNVLKDNKKNYNLIIKKAKRYLSVVMGFNLHELEGHKGSYILLNNVPGSPIFSESSQLENTKIGLLVVILTIIFMNENCISEDDLWKALAKLGIMPDVKHPVFGDVKKYICQELVKQMYLEYKKETGDPPSSSFLWGIRATLEVPKEKLLKFVCIVFDNEMTPEQWPVQYNEVLRLRT